MGNQQKKNVCQEQIHKILFSREIAWQEIIYDLINTEQLDPWDIDIILLTDKYLEKIKEIETDDFFVSSKVLLAAALLLRIKSDALLNEYLRSIDEILFGKKEKKEYSLERIELDEEIPQLILKSPIPRYKKVTLEELIEALNKAIKTENRRIKKVIINKNALRESGISLPKKKISIKTKIRYVYSKITEYFKRSTNIKRVTYADIIGKDKKTQIDLFQSLLQLDYNNKIWLEQESLFGDIYIWLNKTYLEHHPDPFADIKEELDEEIKKIGNKQKSN